MLGLDNKLKPPKPIDGDAYSEDLPPLPRDWASAIHAFSQSEHNTIIFGEKLQTMFASSKAQERDRFAEMISRFEFKTYLNSV